MSKTNVSSNSENQTADKVRIVFQGEAEKLSKRGKGLLKYELAINDTSDAYCVRISANEGGGSCSNEWVNLQTLEEMLSNRSSENENNFKASFFIKAFKGRSSTNSGQRLSLNLQQQI
jgi:hypothetical protein